MLYIHALFFVLFCVVLSSQVAGVATKGASTDTESITRLEERSIR